MSELPQDKLTASMREVTDPGEEPLSPVNVDSLEIEGCDVLGGVEIHKPDPHNGVWSLDLRAKFAFSALDITRVQERLTPGTYALVRIQPTEPDAGEKSITIGDTTITEDWLLQHLTGRQQIHRLRGWEDGDTMHAVRTFNPETGSASGKTYREDSDRDGLAADSAREMYEDPPLPMKGVSVLYTATVRDIKEEPPDPHDPGEPPLVSARLTNVKILDWKQNNG